MNSVKYNNWKDAVRAHQPGGFDAGAAWQKFQQHNRPAQKKRKWLPWLAAACLCGILLSIAIIKNNNPGTAARKPAGPVPEKNNIAEEQPVQTYMPVGPVNSTTAGEEKIPASNDKAGTKNVQKSEAGKETATPALPVPLIIKPEEPANNTTTVIAKVEPVKEEQPVKPKAVLKVVHINELNPRTDYARENTPVPEKRASPVMPFMKASYAQHGQEEPPPPVQKQQRGVLRSIASLKEK